MTLSNHAVQRLRQLVTDAPHAPARYTLHEIIGHGGMGTVYRAHDSVLARDVAFKVLDARSPLIIDASARLRREANILAQLEHPGIVPVHDAGELDNGNAFYVMQLVRGERLDEHVARGVSRGDALRLMLRLCEIVAFANAQGVIHRDLKPGNIMIGPFGETRLLDWGVAKILTQSSDTATSQSAPDPVRAESSATPTADGMIVGTPGYMSPEQASGDSAHVDQTADVYSLGVIMRELLHATPEPSGRALDAIVRRAVADNQRDRYTSAATLAEDIRRWLDGQSVSALRETPTERLLRVYRQHQTAVLLVLTYLVIRVVILLWRHI
ncbi:MAG: serine/threonine-protein kinase [Gemmatimonas sp.]